MEVMSFSLVPYCLVKIIDMILATQIVDLPLQSYNCKLGRKIGRLTIKSEALAGSSVSGEGHNDLILFYVI